MNLQEIIDHGMTYDVIPLPLGEYEGPFYVRKPCTLVGNVTTLWSRQGPALIVESTGVTLSNLRVENIEGKESEGRDLALLSRQSDTLCQNVEIIGRVQGVLGEEGLWQYPRVLSLGQFPAQQKMVFEMEIVIPVAVTLTTNITGLKVSPEHLEPGRQRVSLIFEPCRHGTFFYGEVKLHSQLIHTIYVSALANETLTAPFAQKVYTPERSDVSPLRQDLMLNSSVAYPEGGYVAPVPPELNEQKFLKPLAVAQPLGQDVVLLQRGERRTLLPEMLAGLQLCLTYSERNEPMDIDPYVVLLDAQDKAHRDEDLIFFGNVCSLCGSVTYQETNRQMLVNLSTLPAEVEKVAVVFSIYGERAQDNFSKLAEVALQIKVSDKEVWRFPIIDLSIERTIVAALLYRYQGQWKLNAVGAGYQQGLERLLREYGLEVIK